MRLRLTHPLGSQDFELDSRSADDPIIIGRASDADVKVPSVSVGRAHAAIFVHDGAWIVQDSDSREGTFVNGQKIDVPTRLAINDRITLGPGNTATVEIVSLDVPATFDVAPVPAPVAAPVDADVETDADEQVDPDDESVAFDASAPAPAGYVQRTPGKSTSNAMVIAMSVAGVVIVGSIVLAIWGYYRYQDKMDAIAAAKAQQAVAPPTTVETRKPVERKTMFTDGFGNAPLNPPTPAPATAKPATARPVPAPAPAVQTPEPVAIETPAPAADPREDARPRAGDKWHDAPEWQKVLEAHDASPLPIAILIYTDYKQQFKDSPLLKEADKLIAEALDLLWWERTTQLLSDAKRMESEIAELKKEKASADDKDRKAQIDRQIKDLLDRLATNKLLRDDMKITITAPPNPHDEAAMATLRKARDAAAFENWSQRVLGRIKTTRGASAW